MSHIRRNIYLSLLISALYLFFSTSLGALSHIVAPSDTLFGLSRRYDVPVNWIIRANSLESEIIRPGQDLEIPTTGISPLVVRPGDTLSALALEFGINQTDLRKINDLESDNLRIGQKLKIPAPVPRGTHRVVPGDSLLAIAVRYGLTTEKIRMYNNLDGDVIHPDQILIIQPTRPEGHRVGAGESLWTIARRYNLTMAEIAAWNGLDGDVIHPGDVLTLFPGLDTPDMGRAPQIALATLTVMKPPSDLPREGEYYFSFPDKKDQPSETYWESPDASAATDFRRASKVLEEFQDQVGSLPSLSSALKGWHIVIDPGHGGLDPGAIVSVADGNGNPVVITEDEYAYDISMRLHRILLRNGASVSMTLLSPDHHIRDGIDARQTFVHRKNEVYNDESHNIRNGWRPVGSIDGLDLRKTIAANQISSQPAAAKSNGTLFISIHADNTPDLPSGTAILFDGETDTEAAKSEALATALAAHLGAGSFTRRQELRVLKNNPADAAVLVEARNIHYSRNAWALRSSELREQDATKIADGILAWAE